MFERRQASYLILVNAFRSNCLTKSLSLCARHSRQPGSVTSPLWRGGVVTFAAKPTLHSQNLNKKMYQGAMRSILSELVRLARLLVVENFSVEEPKKRALIARLKAFNLSKVLIVIDKRDDNLFLAARNLHQVEVREVTSLDSVSLIRFERVLMTVPALKNLEENLA